ncbi:MAG TPA: WD40 repeat domain-containing protein [Oculatellaceae cyanobacterium]|jgi:WD40 repeat protein
MKIKPQLWKVITALTLTTSIVTAISTYPTIADTPTSTKQIIRKFITLSGHTAPIRAIALSLDKQTLASGSDDQTIKLWNIKTGQLLRTINAHKDRVTSVAFTPNGKILTASDQENTIKLWNFNNGELLTTLTGHKAGIASIAVSPDSKILVSASEDKVIKLWNLNNNQLLRTKIAEATFLVISPDGKTLFSGSENGTIKQWNLRTFKLQRTLIPPKPKSPPFPGQKASRVYSLAISPSGQTLVNGGYDDSHQTIQETDQKNIKVWNLKTGKVLHNFSMGIGSADTVAISPDGKTFASGGLASSIYLWDLKTGKLLRTLEGHAGGIYALAFTQDGKTLISGSGDKSIKVWQLSP